MLACKIAPRCKLAISPRYMWPSWIRYRVAQPWGASDGKAVTRKARPVITPQRPSKLFLQLCNFLSAFAASVWSASRLLLGVLSILKPSSHRHKPSGHFVWWYVGRAPSSTWFVSFHFLVLTRTFYSPAQHTYLPTHTLPGIR